MPEPKTLAGSKGFTGVSVKESEAGKESACNAGATGDLGLIPGLGRSLGGGNGNPLQDSCLENCMDRGAWWATVCGGVAQSQTQLSMHACIIYWP